MLKVDTQTYAMGKLRVTGCPRCSSPAPALRILGDLCYCTQCGFSGGPVQYLIARGHSCTEVASLLGIQLVPPQRVLRALALAGWLFERQLWGRGDGRATELLRRRGINPTTVSTFHIGVTPARGKLIQSMLRAGFSLEEMYEAGLLRRYRGGYAEQLADRLIFPLQDGAGRIIGFAGRALGDAEPKYLNTRASPSGGRNAALFGLPRAARAIQQRKEAWVVEGYFDVLACWQAGLRWVVAPCGTQLGIRQALLLRRYTDRVTLLYDGDTPRDTLERAARILQSTGIRSRIGRLPAGLDPDEIVLREGPQRLIDIAERGGGPWDG